NSALPPRKVIRSDVARPAVSSRSVTKIRAPARANISAMAAPIPDPAPVISADLLARENMAAIQTPIAGSSKALSQPDLLDALSNGQTRRPQRLEAFVNQRKFAMSKCLTRGP